MEEFVRFHSTSAFNNWPQALSSVDKHVKRSRNRASAWMRMFRGRSRSFRKIRCAQKDIVSLWINVHGFGAVLGCQRFHLAQFVRRVQLENVDLPLTRRNENQPCFGLKDVSVHARADRQRLQDLSTIRIHQDQFLWPPAAGK